MPIIIPATFPSNKQANSSIYMETGKNQNRQIDLKKNNNTIPDSNLL